MGCINKQYPQPHTYHTSHLHTPEAKKHSAARLRQQLSQTLTRPGHMSSAHACTDTTCKDVTRLWQSDGATTCCPGHKRSTSKQQQESPAGSALLSYNPPPPHQSVWMACHQTHSISTDCITKTTCVSDGRKPRNVARIVQIRHQNPKLCQWPLSTAKLLQGKGPGTIHLQQHEGARLSGSCKPPAALAANSLAPSARLSCSCRQPPQALPPAMAFTFEGTIAPSAAAGSLRNLGLCSSMKSKTGRTMGISRGSTRAFSTSTTM